MQNLARASCKVWLPRLSVVLALSMVVGTSLYGSTDPVLNLLISKGVVSEEEASKAEAEAAQMKANNVTVLPEASKWKINKAFKELELFGDLRLRYEDRSAEDPNGGSIGMERFRYSVRLGLRGEVFDDYYFGVRLDTAANPRSAWLTMGSSTSGNPYQGPFGKSTAGIGVGQAYIGWHPNSSVDITLGKMPNPLYTTAMVWDGDLSPEGVAERFKHTVGKADLFATFGQFVYQSSNPTASPGYINQINNNSSSIFLLAWQLGVKYQVTKNVSFKIAPVIYNYIGTGANSGTSFTPDFAGTFVGQGTTNGVGGTPASYSGYPNGSYDGFVANQTGINDLLVLEIPWEVNFDLGKLNLRLLGDYAQNLSGGDRASAAYNAQNNPLLADVGLARISSPQTQDNKAYQIGFAIGNKGSLGLATGAVSKKHAWEFRTFWQHVEQYALDPNLLDSDVFEGRGNMEGIYAAVAYGLTDNLIGTFRYGYASRINNKLGTGGSNQDMIQMNPIEHYNLLQLDVTLKF